MGGGIQRLDTPVLAPWRGRSHLNVRELGCRGERPAGRTFSWAIHPNGRLGLGRLGGGLAPYPAIPGKTHHRVFLFLLHRGLC